jgi:hypothetical protein
MRFGSLTGGTALPVLTEHEADLRISMFAWSRANQPV